MSKESESFIKCKKAINKLLREERKLCDDYLIGECHTDYTDVLDRIQELKEKYK